LTFLEEMGEGVDVGNGRCVQMTMVVMRILEVLDTRDAKWYIRE